MTRALRAARCVLRGGAAVLALALCLAGNASAQDSPYLPLDDIGYRYIDALMARGALRGLSALERPYTVIEIRRALDADSSDAGGVVASWRSAVRESIARFDPRGGREGIEDDLVVRADFSAFATARSSASREPILASGDGGAYPGLSGRFAAQGGPLVAAVRVVMDNALKDDPEYVGKKNRIVAGRTSEAYLGVTTPYVRAAAGRVARNLGPYALHGLQIGHYAFTYEHLYAELGTRRFHLATIVASLDPIRVADTLANRYLALHRLSGRWGGLEIGLTEAMLFGGPGRRFEPGYLNPLNIYQLSQYNEHRSGNVSFAIDAAWRTRGRGTFAGQLLIDDIQVDDCEVGCKEPPSYGLVLSAEGVPLWGAQRAFASYARVSNLTYRTPTPYEQWTSFGLSLGHPRSDYDEVRAGLDLAAAPRVAIRPYAAWRRQGEGDYRAAFPAPEDYDTTPEIHLGVVERTTRLGVRGAWMPSSVLHVEADAGWNRLANAGHVAGAEESAFEGWVRVTVESPWVFARVLDRD